MTEQLDNLTHPDLLRREAAAELLGLKAQTLACWTHRGEGPPYVKLGHSVRYRRSDLDRWVESRVVRPAAGEA